MLIFLQLMAVGVTGHLTQNALTHVAEVPRHVNGIVTIQVRRMEGCFVQEMEMQLIHVTRTIVQVVINMFLKFAIPKYKQKHIIILIKCVFMQTNLKRVSAKVRIGHLEISVYQQN